MSFFKLNGSAGVMLVTLAMLMASSQGASAGTIFLACPSAVNTDAATLTVDVTNNTVNNYSAKIDTTSIDWEHNVPCEDCTGPFAVTKPVRQTYHLDRTTGTLTVVDKFSRVDGNDAINGPFTYACTVSSAPSTKF